MYTSNFYLENGLHFPKLVYSSLSKFTPFSNVQKNDKTAQLKINSNNKSPV